MVKHTVVSTSCNTKLHKKSCNEKGNRAIKLQCLQICDKECWQCAWDHWKSIAANQGRYRSEFATSKTPRIRVVCVMSLTVNKPMQFATSRYFECATLHFNRQNSLLPLEIGLTGSDLFGLVYLYCNEK